MILFKGVLPSTSLESRERALELVHEPVGISMKADKFLRTDLYGNETTTIKVKCINSSVSE